MKLRKVIFIMILVTFITTSLLYSQFEPDGQKVELPRQLKNRTDIKSEVGGFYVSPNSYWPKITVGGVVTAVLAYVALFFGIMSFFIGHYAGGKLAKGKILASVMTATIIGILSRSIIVFAEIKLIAAFTNFFKMNYIIASTIVESISFFLTLLIVSAIAVNIYETFTVTAREALSPH